MRRNPVSIVWRPVSRLHQRAIHKSIPVEGQDDIFRSKRVCEINVALRDWAVSDFVQRRSKKKDKLIVRPRKNYSIDPTRLSFNTGQLDGYLAMYFFNVYTCCEVGIRILYAFLRFEIAYQPITQHPRV